MKSDTVIYHVSILWGNEPFTFHYYTLAIITKHMQVFMKKTLYLISLFSLFSKNISISKSLFAYLNEGNKHVIGDF